MITFENWYSELTSDTFWFDQASMRHKPETFRECARKVYMQCVANQDFKPMTDCRRHVYAIVCKVNPDATSKTWFQQKEKEEQEAKKDWKPVSAEDREKWLKKWKEEISKMQMVSAVPRVSYTDMVKLAEEGGVLPPKPAPYPTTTKEEAYVKDRHIAYVKFCYEPRTGEKLPNWLPEDEFNYQYDNGLIDL